MTRFYLSPAQRDRIATVVLVALLMIACPLIGSLLAGLNTPPAENTPTATRVPPSLVPVPSVETIPTETATPSPSSIVTPSLTPTPAPSRTPTATSTPLPRVYLAPFRRVFMEGQTLPVPSTPALYENASDVFFVVDRQGTYVRLQTLDGRGAFWTGAENVSADPPPAPQYDFSVRGQTVRFAGATGIACQHQSNVTPPIALCQSLGNFTGAVLTARITSGNSVVYLAEINGQSYFILLESGSFS